MSKVKVRGFEVLEEYKELVSSIVESKKEEFGVSDSNDEDISDYWLPRRETEGSAGYDIRSIETVEVPPHEMRIIGTGLTAYMQLREVLDIRPRSGLAAKYKVTVINTPGTIDSDYYGKHIMVMLINFSDEPIVFCKGDRVAQGIFNSYLVVDNDNPKDSERNGGLGSTGIN